MKIKPSCTVTMRQFQWGFILPETRRQLEQLTKLLVQRERKSDLQEEDVAGYLLDIIIPPMVRVGRMVVRKERKLGRKLTQAERGDFVTQELARLAKRKETRP